MPDHAAMFTTLYKLIVSDVSPHVVTLHSSQCQALKSAILNVALQLVPTLSVQVSGIFYVLTISCNMYYILRVHSCVWALKLTIFPEFVETWKCREFV